MSEVDIKRPALTEEHSRGIGIVVLFLILAAHKQARSLPLLSGVVFLKPHGRNGAVQIHTRNRFISRNAKFHGIRLEFERSDCHVKV